MATYAITLGERVPSYASTTHRAAVQPMRPGKLAEFGLEISVSAVAVYFASDPGLKSGDQIVLGSRTFEVIAPAQDQGGRQRVFMVPCREVR